MSTTQMEVTVERLARIRDRIVIGLLGVAVLIMASFGLVGVRQVQTTQAAAKVAAEQTVALREQTGHVEELLGILKAQLDQRARDNAERNQVVDQAIHSIVKQINDANAAIEARIARDHGRLMSDDKQLREEVARLRAEVARLRAVHPAPPPPPPRVSGTRAPCRNLLGIGCPGR